MIAGARRTPFISPSPKRHAPHAAGGNLLSKLTLNLSKKRKLEISVMEADVRTWPLPISALAMLPAVVPVVGAPEQRTEG